MGSGISELLVRPLLMPILVPFAATAIAWGLSTLVPEADFAMIYLAGVLLTAVTTRTGSALCCALVSFLAYTFFHTEPHFSLFIVHQGDILTASLFVVVALVTGQLAGRLNEKVTALESSDLWNHHQIDLAQQLSGNIKPDYVIDVLARQISRCFGLASHAFYRAGVHETFSSLSEDNRTSPQLPVIPKLTQTDQVWVLEDEDQFPSFIGFNVGSDCLGLIEITERTLADRGNLLQLEAFINLARLAWSRTLISATLRRETIVKEQEQLRSALLSSISHDLRTPLATMIGSLSSLVELQASLSRQQTDELIANTLSEAERLDRYIQKLLDMTRLGYGTLTLDRDWVGLDDILSVVLKRVDPLLHGLKIDLDLAQDLPLLYVHPALIEQALFNVIENAVHFAPSESTIAVVACVAGSDLHIDVMDQGPGIPKQNWDDIFDMFYTFSQGDQYRSGTGLGLAICQGVLGAHGGKAFVLESSAGDGTTIRIRLPLVQAGRSETGAD